jgi:hypothetical protein
VKVAETIHIDVQLSAEEIDASLFQDMIADLLSMIRDIEKHVSSNTRQRAHWLWAEDEPQLRIEAISNGVPVEELNRVAREVRTGFQRILDSEGKTVRWPETFGPPAKNAAQRIVKKLDKVQSITVKIDSAPPLIIDHVVLNEEFGRPGYVEFSSIDGYLDLISVRGKPHFSIEEHSFPKHRIRCTFPDDIFETVKNSLGKRVVVEGLVRWNKAGIPVAITEVKSLWVRPEPQLMFDQIVGSRPNFTGGISAGEYVRRLREGDAN